MLHTPRNNNRIRSTRRHRSLGFSLLELVVVISIGAILIGVGIPVLRHNQDTRNLEASAARLQTFLADSANMARSKNVAVLVRSVSGSSFAECAEIRCEVSGTTAYTRTFTPDSGITFRGGPAVPAVAFLSGGSLDVQGQAKGYLALQGTHSDHVAYVTFNATGIVGRSATQPTAQITSAEVGTETGQLLASSGTGITGTGAMGGAGVGGGADGAVGGASDVAPTPTPKGDTGGGATFGPVGGGQTDVRQ